MKRALGAAVILIAAACSPGTAVDTAGPSAGVPAASAIPTTQALPTAVPVQPTVAPAATPTAIEVPTAESAGAVEPTASPQVVEPTATTSPAPTPSNPAPSPTLAPVPTPVPASTDSEEVRATNGAEVYTLNCARCHAENGSGSQRYSGLIGVGNKYSTAGMIAELTSGHPVTFGFGDRLSADEISSVVAYVKATFP